MLAGCGAGGGGSSGPQPKSYTLTVTGTSGYPAHLYPCLRFAEHLAVCNAKLRAERFATPFS